MFSTIPIFTSDIEKLTTDGGRYWRGSLSIEREENSQRHVISSILYANGSSDEWDKENKQNGTNIYWNCLNLLLFQSKRFVHFDWESRKSRKNKNSPKLGTIFHLNDNLSNSTFYFARSLTWFAFYLIALFVCSPFFVLSEWQWKYIELTMAGKR